MWDPAAEAAVAIGVAQEVDDLAQLLLCFLDPGDVGEGHLVARGLIAARAGAPERAEDVLHAAWPRRNSQNRRRTNRIVGPKPNRSVCHQWCAGVERLGVDDHVVLLEQLRQLVGIGERGDLRSESSRRLRVLERRLFLERALDVRPLRRDLVDVARLHLLEEERAVRDPYPRLRPHYAAREEEVTREQNDEENDPARARPVPRASWLRRRRVARRRRWRLLRGILGRWHGPTLLLCDGAQPLAVVLLARGLRMWPKPPTTTRFCLRPGDPDAGLLLARSVAEVSEWLSHAQAR